MKSIEGIKNGIANKFFNRIIARKIYLGFPTNVFVDNEEMEFDIKNNIATELNITFSCIEVCGSAKTGISFIKDYLFKPGESDLDVSIINPTLYNYYMEISHEKTDGFNNLTLFPIINGKRTDRQFLNGLNKGFLNPFYMPSCPEKTHWFGFFNSLSNKYYKQFKNINAGIYSTEYFFEKKQEECIELYLKETKKYDKISGTI